MPANYSINRAPRGMISLLSLILMAAVTATAIGAAAIIINELRQTESLEQSFSAVYAAEAGLEDGLYVVKLQRSANATLVSTIDILNAQPSRSYLLNGSAWTPRASLENQFIVSRLPVDTSAHLDIFNPDEPRVLNIRSLVARWGVTCNRVMEMEVTMLTWEISGNQYTFNPSDQLIYKETFACNQGANFVCQPITLTGVAGVQIDPNRPYRFSFRVLIPDRNLPPEQAARCYGENVSVNVYDHVSQQTQEHLINLPNRVLVRSTGRYARSQQSLTASVPWRAPISGLFGFVVFSDIDLVK